MRRTTGVRRAARAVRPVPAAPLMFEAPEFEAPLLEPPEPAGAPAPAARAAAGDAPLRRAGDRRRRWPACAPRYFLAQDGADVLLAERDEAGMAASTANAGSLHVQLLSYDFDDDTPQDGGPAAHTLPLAPRSIALWKQIAAEAGEDLGIRTEGGLMLAENAAGIRLAARASRRWSGAGASRATCSAPTSCATWRPHLADTMVGADFVPAEG